MAQRVPPTRCGLRSNLARPRAHPTSSSVHRLRSRTLSTAENRILQLDHVSPVLCEQGTWLQAVRGEVWLQVVHQCGAPVTGVDRLCLARSRWKCVRAKLDMSPKCRCDVLSCGLPLVDAAGRLLADNRRSAIHLAPDNCARCALKHDRHDGPAVRFTSQSLDSHCCG